MKKMQLCPFPLWFLLHPKETSRLLHPRVQHLQIFGLRGSSPCALTLLMTVSAFKRLAMHYLLLQKVPICDASKQPFLFQQDNFASMQGLPHYKEYRVRSWSDLPHQSLVSVSFTLNTYPKDYSSSSRADTGFSAPSPVPTNNNSVLSFNLHFVVYYGVIPDQWWHIYSCSYKCHFLGKIYILPVL